MKTFSFKSISLLVASSILVMSSCNDDESVSTEVITAEEVADLAASSLSENSAGLVLTIANGTDVAEEAVVSNDGGRIAACDYGKDSVFTKTNEAGSLVTYSYTFNYSYALSCGGGEPQSLTASMGASGQFDGARVASTNSSNATLVITALDHTLTQYSVNGAYTREGTFQSKVRNMTSSSSTISMIIDDVLVDKTSKIIAGGSATLNIAGTVAGKGPFSYSATVTFEGNGLCTMVINGTTYNINLITGEAS